MPRVIVVREARLRLIDSPASVIVDGIKRAELPINSGADFLVSVGRHKVAIRVGWNLGDVVEFSIAEHETIKFVCSESGYLRVNTHLREIYRTISHDRF
jgi:hypothetical protein